MRRCTYLCGRVCWFFTGYAMEWCDVFLFPVFILTPLFNIWASKSRSGEGVCLRFHGCQEKGQVHSKIPATPGGTFSALTWCQHPTSGACSEWVRTWWLPSRQAWLHIRSVFLLTQGDWRSQKLPGILGLLRMVSAGSTWHAQWRTVDTTWHTDGPPYKKEPSSPKRDLTSMSLGHVVQITPTSHASPATLSAAAPSSFFLATSVQVTVYLCSARLQGLGRWYPSVRSLSGSLWNAVRECGREWTRVGHSSRNITGVPRVIHTF